MRGQFADITGSPPLARAGYESRMTIQGAELPHSSSIGG